MFDISKEKIDFNCPDCGKKIQVTLAQVSHQATVTCSGCRQSIKLQDNNGGASKSIRDINGAMRGLENSLKKLGR